MDAVGLYYYNARWYDPLLNRSTQPDTIVPDPTKPTDYDRYAYVQNNPIAYNDPTGHKQECGHDGDTHCGTGIGYATPTEMIEEYFFMRGGVGSGVSYGEQAEYSYTEFTTSGGGIPAFDILGIVNDFLIWIRDNTNIIECIGNSPSGSIQVFVKPEIGGSKRLIGVRILNFSPYDLELGAIKGYLSSPNSKTELKLYYPPRNLSIHSSIVNAYAAVELNMDQLVYQWQSLSLSVNLKNEMGRFSEKNIVIPDPNRGVEQ